jgi:hypothetical protein
MTDPNSLRDSVDKAYGYRRRAGISRRGDLAGILAKLGVNTCPRGWLVRVRSALRQPTNHCIAAN